MKNKNFELLKHYESHEILRTPDKMDKSGGKGNNSFTANEMSKESYIALK